MNSDFSWPVALMVLFSLAASGISLAQNAVKTEIMVTDDKSIPVASAKVMVLTVDDEIVAEGPANDHGIYTCPEIDTDLRSLQVVVTRGRRCGEAKINLTGHGTWPARITVKLRERRIQPICKAAVTP